MFGVENVLLPTLVAEDRADYPKRARNCWNRWPSPTAWITGLGAFRGERQRVALARALICRPHLLLCDEPRATSTKLRRGGASLLLELHARQETMLIVVTHSSALAGRFPRRYELRHANLHPAGA